MDDWKKETGIEDITIETKIIGENKYLNILIIIKRILLAAYSFLLTYGTLLGRQHHEPLSAVFTGWTVYRRRGVWNFDALYNVFLLTPLLFLLLWNFPGMAGRGRKRLIIQCAVIGFFVSLFIEGSQLIFCIGTFQIADLVYNTLSGVIGGLLYIDMLLVKGIIKEKKEIKR